MDLERVAAHDAVPIDDPPRESAVVLPVVERADGPAILFTRRADHLSSHPGQMSFPGGGREPADADLLATALREAREEVGLTPASVEVVGRLDDLQTISRYAIRPFVARVPDREYVPTDEEVAETTVLAVPALTDPANYGMQERDHPEHGTVTLHFFTVDGHTVWGATARILVQFLQVALGWQPPADAHVADEDLPDEVREAVS